MTFILPPGFRMWCHECGRPPRSVVSKVYLPENPSDPEGKQIVQDIPGVGLKSWEEHEQHQKEFHDYRKG